jgi:poly-gamma-glutamate synthesis protein (capsule biosynthesis protein)
VTFTLAAAGDAIVTRRLASTAGEDLTPLLDRIRDADAGFVNLEVLLHDYEGYPAADSGGTYMRAPPWVADELRAAGFDLFAAANNHTGDYCRGGMEATMRELDAREISYAGLGRTLADARAPAYFDAQNCRVGLVAACTTFPDGSEAGRQRPDMQGRPGLSPLSLETRYVVPEDTLRQVRDLSEGLGLEAVKERRAEQGFPVPGEDAGRDGDGDEEDGDETFTLPNVGDGDHLTFEEGDEHRVERRIAEDDAEAVLRQVRAADRQADWVVASLHVHEGTGGSKNDESVPGFLKSFAHDCVEAGADAVVGHGPHVLRGVEVHDGAPIFYSLGDFAMQNETVSKLPAEIYERYDLDPTDALPADLSTSGCSTRTASARGSSRTGSSGRRWCRSASSAVAAPASSASTCTRPRWVSRRTGPTADAPVWPTRRSPSGFSTVSRSGRNPTAPR